MSLGRAGIRLFFCTPIVSIELLSGAECLQGPRREQLPGIRAAPRPGWCGEAKATNRAINQERRRRGKRCASLKLWVCAAFPQAFLHSPPPHPDLSIDQQRERKSMLFKPFTASPINSAPLAPSRGRSLRGPGCRDSVPGSLGSSCVFGDVWMVLVHSGRCRSKERRWRGCDRGRGAEDRHHSSSVQSSACPCGRDPVQAGLVPVGFEGQIHSRASGSVWTVLGWEAVLAL